MNVLGAILGDPRLYNAVQVLFGLPYTQQRLAPHLAAADGQTVLDVGAGTSLVAPLLPASTRYIWLDNDPRKLALAVRCRQPAAAVIADAARLPLRPASVDVGICLAVSHHLTDAELDAMVAGLARVVRNRLIFLDALACPESLRSRLLWRLDRGSHPRSGEALQAILGRAFVLEHVEHYTVYHRYMLCVAAPQPIRNS